MIYSIHVKYMSHVNAQELSFKEKLIDLIIYNCGYCSEFNKYSF